MTKPYYQDKFCTIYHGNCLDIMPELEPVDLVLTDPPYGIKRDGGLGCNEISPFGKKSYAPIRKYEDNWDNKRPENMLDIISKARHSMVFGGQFFTDILPMGGHWIFWDKLNKMPTYGDGELIWTNFPRNSVKKITRQWHGLLGKEPVRFHPTQKPLELMKMLLAEYSKTIDIILDPFMGSGTTLVAAKQLNRKAIGIEIEEKYCEIAVRRLAQEVMEFK